MDKIAYFSPLNPVRSGISDYSEDLLPYLKEYYEIDVFVPNGFEIENKIIKMNFNIKTHEEFPRLYAQKEYSSVVYHMGNNYHAHKEIYELMLQYPGIVVLHDFSLHHFYAAKTLENGNFKAYEDEMFYSHGNEGLLEVERFVKGEIPPIWETNSLQFPLNLRVLDTAAGVIVHSRFAQKLLHEIASYVPITVAPIPAPYIAEDIETVHRNKIDARNYLNLDPNKLIFSTLGFTNHTKRVDKILEALYDLKKEKFLEDFKFYIVGQVADNYPLEDKIRRLGLTNEVVITGFVDLQDFDRYIAASDICFNLRYPTQGENSASLLRIMGHGKPVITTDIGSFSEFPEDIVSKVSYGKEEKEDIVNCLRKLLDFGGFDLKNQRIIDFTRNKHTILKCVQEYNEFLNKIKMGELSNIYLPIKKVMCNYQKNSSSILINNFDRNINQFADSIFSLFKA
ncbi:glycosyltransferase family 4 protein [Paenibacillus doosanensis]|uniref:glycosyltransferase family 4 protein n=1 Tax=Paenibacillus doosanensis TaxID=1229154 RepID=UPI00217FDB5B|nr:glycosyltransferase family 4 protein [Paenibacillus doosanensis]MCS7464248.1 glycosyltransferase family 4 protein [Paenibacillus doosanensis]